jgi:hypothetical protein
MLNVTIKSNMLNVIMLSVFMLSVIKLSVIILSVVTLNVVVPKFMLDKHELLDLKVIPVVMSWDFRQKVFNFLI